MQKSSSAVRYQKRHEPVGAWHNVRVESRRKATTRSTTKIAYEQLFSRLGEWHQLDPKWYERMTMAFTTWREKHEPVVKDFPHFVLPYHTKWAGSALTDVMHHHGQREVSKDTISQQSEIEKTLSEVHRNRETLAALMED